MVSLGVCFLKSLKKQYSDNFAIPGVFLYVCLRDTKGRLLISNLYQLKYCLSLHCEICRYNMSQAICQSQTELPIRVFTTSVLFLRLSGYDLDVWGLFTPDLPWPHP